MAQRNVSDNGGGNPVIGGRSIQDMLPMSNEDIEHYKRQAQDLDRQARAFIRDNPTAVVVGAVAVGFIIGRLLSR